MTEDGTYVTRAIELATEAVEAGNTPFGALLVVDGEVVREARNMTRTDDDLTAHPELLLARWAGRALDPSELANCTMYRQSRRLPRGLTPGLKPTTREPLIQLSTNCS